MAVTLNGVKQAAGEPQSSITVKYSIRAKHLVEMRASGMTAGQAVEAGANSTYIIGVSTKAIGAGMAGNVRAFGVQTVISAEAINQGDLIRCAGGGRAGRYASQAETIVSDIAGSASFFTQPSSPTLIEIVQATDTPADRGRGIVIYGVDALVGVAATETISLHATNTTTTVASTTEWTAVLGVATEDGQPVGADVTIRVSSGGATIVTLASGQASVGVVAVPETPLGLRKILYMGDEGTETGILAVFGRNADWVAAGELLSIADGAGEGYLNWTILTAVATGGMPSGTTGSIRYDADPFSSVCGQAMSTTTAAGRPLDALIWPNAALAEVIEAVN